MSKVFISERTGSFIYVCNNMEYDLGTYRPGKYIWARRGNFENQLCDGGGWRGNTLGFRAAKNRRGDVINVPDYEGLPNDEVLIWLASVTASRIGP